MPSYLTGIDGDSVINEPSSDDAFHFADSAIECLSVFDERSELAVFFGGHMDGFEM